MKRTALQLLYTALILLNCLAMTGVGKAQERVLSSSIAAGPLLKISPAYPSSEINKTISLAYEVQPVCKAWHQSHKFPHVGVQLLVHDFGNRAVLGHGLGIGIHYRKSIGQSRALQPFYQLYAGAMLYSRYYDFTDNRTNSAIGTWYTALFAADIGLNYNASKRVQMFSSVRFIHGSNSHSALPNLGINIPEVAFGARVRLREALAEMPAPSAPMDNSKSWIPHLSLGWGFNENGTSTWAANGPKYPIYLIKAGAKKRIGANSAISLGVQGYYNSSYRSYVASQELSDYENTALNSSVFLVDLGYELLFGHIGATVHAGVNLYNPFFHYYLKSEGAEKLSQRSKALVPGKVGINYYLKSPYNRFRHNMYFGVYVKSNVGQADFLETAIGFLL